MNKRQASTKKKADKVAKRYDKTMSGMGGKAKPTVKAKIKRSGWKPRGFKVTMKF